MTSDLMVLWFTSMGAVLALGVLIGTFAVHDRYVEAVRGCEIIARYDKAATAWLRGQTASRVARQKPSPEDHIKHLHAVAAVFVASLRIAIRRLFTADQTGWAPGELAAFNRQRATPLALPAWLPPTADRMARVHLLAASARKTTEFFGGRAR